jgi:hypothetical protein
LYQAYLQEVVFENNPIHLAILILCWFLKRSVKRTWTGSTFSTNESASSAQVTVSQSRVWSGPNPSLWVGVLFLLNVDLNALR